MIAKKITAFKTHGGLIRIRQRRYKFYLKGRDEPVCITAKNMIEAKNKLLSEGFGAVIIAISNRVII